MFMLEPTVLGPEKINSGDRTRSDTKSPQTPGEKTKTTKIRI